MLDYISMNNIIEPVLLPTKDTFGLMNQSERSDLIYLLADKGIDRVNIEYPTEKAISDANKMVFQNFLNNLISMADDFAENKFDISLSNCDQVEKITSLSNSNCPHITSRLKYFDSQICVPEVENFCDFHGYKYLPSANRYKRVPEKYNRVKCSCLDKSRFSNPLKSLSELLDKTLES